MEEIRLTTWDVKKPVNNGVDYQPQLVNAGFLNHQQYDLEYALAVLFPGDTAAPFYMTSAYIILMLGLFGWGLPGKNVVKN